MATKVHMEALSPTMEEGQIVRWLKSEGDEVTEGDVLAEIETDKATMELVARGKGVLRKRMLEEGATAPVGTVIGVIAGADEDISGLADQESVGEPAETADGQTERDRAAAGVDAAAETEERAPTPRPEDAAPDKTEAPVSAQAEEVEAEAEGEPGGRIKASPLARRLAAEGGIELRRVKGSGPGGRITKRDVEAALEAGPPAAAPSEAAAPAAAAPAGPRFVQPVYEGPEVEEVPVSQMRKTIAKRLVTSIGPIPTFYLTTDVDMTRVVAVRERMNRQLEASGQKVSVNDLIVRITAAALKRHPEVNASWHDDHIKRHHRVHIGVAVAVEDGLITPVIRDADLKGAAQIGAEVRELAGRAREKRLKPEEYTGATFSISNLGMFGIEEFTAIINPPEAAILAIGQVEDRVVVEDGDVVVAPRMKVTMSCDHRVVDGATGARFLQTLRALLEEPGMVMV
jgi:pyruvate dehydrogenase E2 component (dihydrolipoamide acetyltransferase)